MKKNTLPIICLVLLCCVTLLSSCGKDKNYESNVYEYVQDYKSTTCNVLKDNNIELHVENSVTESKNEIEKLLNVLKTDYAILEKAFNLGTQIKCYVIADEYILGDEKAVYQNNVLLCNESSVRDGKYGKSLTAAYIQSTEYWKRYGAYAYAFNCEYDDGELKDYYAKDKDLELTLFSAYFIKDFSNNVDIAIKTAYSLGNFILSNYGYDKFIEASLTDYRTEYLEALGIKRKFNAELDLSWLNDAVYSRKFLSYPLIIKTDNRTFYLNAFSAKRETASFDTPERVLYHLSAGNTECDKILNYIKENASDSYEFVRERYADNIEYFISDSVAKTHCDVDGKKIYLLDPSEYVHETIHAVTLRSNPTAEAWIGEGIAEYLSRYVSKHVSDINNRFYLSFTDKTLTGSIADFVNTVNTLYGNKGGKFDSLAEFDFALMEICIGETTLKRGEYKSEISFPYATTPIYKTYSCGNEDGNVLTYPEAYAFTHYLIEKYGFSNVLKSCINYKSENVCGFNYSDLMNDFTESIL